MSKGMIAAALRELIALGVEGEALIAAIGRIEASGSIDGVSKGAERTRRWRDKKDAEASQKASQASQGDAAEQASPSVTNRHQASPCDGLARVRDNNPKIILTGEETHTLSADDVRAQSAEVSEAAGDALADMARSPGIASLAPLRSLLKGDPPCDWREDVLPAVQSAAAWHRSRDGPGSMRSWTTAVRIAIENRDRRLAGLPPRNERPGPHPSQAAAADPRRANTDSRRRAWAEVAAERDGAPPGAQRGPGAAEPADRDVPSGPRLVHASAAPGGRSRA